MIHDTHMQVYLCMRSGSPRTVNEEHGEGREGGGTHCALHWLVLGAVRNAWGGGDAAGVRREAGGAAAPERPAAGRRRYVPVGGPTAATGRGVSFRRAWCG